MPPTGGKKPFQQSMPEPALEPIQGSAIVVIHPGSYNLRLGRAADTFPHVLPHCIARRHKQPGKQKQYEDPLLLRPNDEHSQAQTLREWGLKHAIQALANKATSLCQVREPTTEEQLRLTNKKVKAEVTSVMTPNKWTDTTIKREYLIGDEALHVHPCDHYCLHWPLRQGRFNIHDGPGGTPSTVLQDLETIWSYAIQNFLGIPLKDLKHYRAALIVQDLYKRKEVREMLTLLLERIGFSAAFVVQESVCATFGAGVSSACVVDMGDQKTAISCVEDGLSQKKSRLLLEYGGRDITRCFHWLLKRSGFPYQECDLATRVDALFLQSLKEEHCCLDKDSFGTFTKHIQVRHPQKHVVKYTFNMGDERLLAPLALFFPNMLGLIGTKVCQNVERYRSDPADPLDEDYLMQTMSKHEQAARLVALRKKENASVAEQLSQNNDSTMLEDSQMDDDDTLDPPEGASSEAPSAGGISKLIRKMEEEEEGVDISDGLMGLDEAICRSIERCESEEMKRRMYSCVLVIGGGYLFPGGQNWLGELIWAQMPPHIRTSLDTMDIVVQPKDFDPRLTCWKGCAIMCCLDTCQELWIRQKEWKRYGVRVLRERAPFIW